MKLTQIWLPKIQYLRLTWNWNDKYFFANKKNLERWKMFFEFFLSICPIFPLLLKSRSLNWQPWTHKIKIHINFVWSYFPLVTDCHLTFVFIYHTVCLLSISVVMCHYQNVLIHLIFQMFLWINQLKIFNRDVRESSVAKTAPSWPAL